MNIGIDYPPRYRQTEIQTLRRWLQAGKCAWVAGLSGCGKSALLAALMQFEGAALGAVWVNMQALEPPDAASLFRAALLALGEPMPSHGDWFSALEVAVERRLLRSPGRVCLLLDGYDRAANSAVELHLRSLHDDFDRRLSYVTTARRAPAYASELDELFTEQTLWLGPLGVEDARWTARQAAARMGFAWEAQALSTLVSLTGGYPALITAACEAFADGCPLTLEDLRIHPAVVRRVDAVWAQSPSAGELERLQLDKIALLKPVEKAPAAWETQALTDAEGDLLEYLMLHPHMTFTAAALCAAVWPEGGPPPQRLPEILQRLMRKVEPDPARPVYIHLQPDGSVRFTPAHQIDRLAGEDAAAEG
ncbi:winged helix-turn-helix domain-containing protein [Levilinea saccharolytica]|uniref:Response regulator consisting of a CheY-like receiver domain and a winged-helix DNA-binding domain n=1 Tax=Levilinea saccharolytica TaxID=229921 RepID=A0A0M8JPV7_9CHLR|nr:winged helix-turn-helix domain-containing protein [Levilinea saccharolytica]KPL80876.1 hypothetical protein ADN01_10265 [Levilinea saccharolytica]GAP19357.1 response regulator consisting of a CheY-like receiver domain and a winged-helix DNA-binding domain [Levilinea saccharolytica]